MTGWTAAFIAIWRGEVNVFKQLWKYGVIADLNVRTLSLTTIVAAIP